MDQLFAITQRPPGNPEALKADITFRRTPGGAPKTKPKLPVDRQLFGGAL